MSKFFKNILSLLFVSGIIACNGENNNATVTDNKTAESISKLKLADLNGQSIDLEQYNNKTVFVNFWATWCKPCLQEMPSIQRAKEVLKHEDIVFLFASDETAGQIEGFKSVHDYDFNYVRAENLEELNIMALPTTFIFDKKGKLVFSEMGYKKWDDKKNIEMILNIAKQK